MTDQNINKRDKMLERIINLRNRADNGASEAEAMTSLKMAAKLMDAYQVEEAELAMAEAEGRVNIEVVSESADTSCKNGRNRHRIMQTFYAIGKFTNTRIVSSTYTGNVTITGDKPDFEIANYLLNVIRNAMDKGYEQYKKETVGVGRGAKAAFQQAMAYTISDRLILMKEKSDKERRNAANGIKDALKIGDTRIDSSTALVMIDITKQKHEQVEAAMKNKYGNRLRNSKGFGGTRNGTAHGAGAAAGRKVNLNKAIRGRGSKALTA